MIVIPFFYKFEIATNCVIMFSILSLIKSKRSDSFIVLNSLLNRFGVRYTIQRVNKLLEEHAEFPSLLAIKDILSYYGVESEAIKKGRYSYADFETPFVCSIQQSDWSNSMFTVVIHADEDTVTYIDPLKDREVKVDSTEFEMMDKEIVLLLDGDHAVDEAGYEQNRKYELKNNILSKTPFFIFILPILLTSIYLLSNNLAIPINWVSLIFLASSSVGLLTSILLLWHDIDVHNPFLKEVCGGQGKKINCNAVLNSKESDFLGISWSTWGFAYFSSFFLIQLFYPGQVAQLSIWSGISLLASLYILYSIYYQWRVIKQWCTLCLTVQMVLLLNAFVSIVFIINNSSFQWEWYVVSITVLIGVSFLVLSHFAVPLIKQAKDGGNYERKWKKLRYNSDIFQALLQKSESITVPVDGIGIVVGNPDAKQEIIKVCNPYCGPCSSAHSELEHIIRHNPDIRLRIIFTADGKESDIKTPPVKHLLAIEENLSQEILQQALDDWYLLDNKDYQVFAEKYPMNGELNRQDEKIKKMRKWCDDMKIRATPTIYIDGKELPDGYRIRELKNIL